MKGTYTYDDGADILSSAPNHSKFLDPPLAISGTLLPSTSTL